MSSGRVRRAWIGVGGASAPLPPPLAERFGRRHGVRITQVVPDSPAAVAGLRAGDILVTVGDRPITVIQDLTRFMLDAPIGGRLPVTVVRSGAFVDVIVVPDELTEG
jgi:S1-C subfamily serine protease